MVKRTVAAPLWFVSIWLAYGLVAYFTGWPESAGGILGALAAAFVFTDPTGVFWRSTGQADRIGIQTAPAVLDGSRSTS